MKQLGLFIWFSRPHTVIGTTFSVLALYLLTFSYSETGAWHFDLLAMSWLACFGANIFIVGLNQLTDIEIDKINKPYLPLASGAYTPKIVRWILGLSVATALLTAVLTGPFLLLTVILSLLLGTAYSLPPVRLKRFTFWAAFCIIAVRGLIVNLLLFLHFHSYMNGRYDIPLLVYLLTGVIFIYSIVIAWFKDIPDMIGDAAHKIKTLSIRLGPKRVFLMGNGLISAAYLIIIFIALTAAPQPGFRILAGAHLIFLLLLWVVNSRVQLQQISSVRQYYQFIWVLFFLEYAAFAGASLI